MPIIGTPRSFHKRFKFIVEVDGLTSAGFQKCSELSVEVAKVEQWEGGAITPNKSPGRLTFSDVTLERGATMDHELYDWFLQVADAAAHVGKVEPQYKRGLDIVQLDLDGTSLRRWSLSGAWPTKFVAGEWDNTADENVLESVTLTYDFFERKQR
jgi:phage tail-like protein